MHSIEHSKEEEQDQKRTEKYNGLVIDWNPVWGGGFGLIISWKHKKIFLKNSNLAMYGLVMHSLWDWFHSSIPEISWLNSLNGAK